VGKTKNAAVVEVDEGERLQPAARATDPQRREMQAALLDCARLRTEYRGAVAALDEARELVSQGEKNENFLVIRQHAADAIAREIDRRENEFPQKLRRSCPDVALRRELQRLTKKRLATQTRLATASADLQHEQRRWRDREADFRQLGTEGHDWIKVDTDAALGTYAAELVGTAASIPLTQRIARELNELAAEVVESLALVAIEHNDAAAEHQATMAAFEDCRHRMTWGE
jgi:hypothetical protein